MDCWGRIAFLILDLFLIISWSNLLAWSVLRLYTLWIWSSSSFWVNPFYPETNFEAANEKEDCRFWDCYMSYYGNVSCPLEDVRPLLSNPPFSSICLLLFLFMGFVKRSITLLFLGFVLSYYDLCLLMSELIIFMIRFSMLPEVVGFSPVPSSSPVRLLLRSVSSMILFNWFIMSLLMNYVNLSLLFRRSLSGCSVVVNTLDCSYCDYCWSSCRSCSSCCRFWEVSRSAC